ncbi:unnamed protein product [Dicrocoelium dendriticum]|nr:unnamed protein product [Dicrocoelium dendriticum]
MHVFAYLNSKDGLNPLEVAARASYTTFVDLIIKADRWRNRHPDRADALRGRLLSIPGSGSSPLVPTTDDGFSPRSPDDRIYTHTNTQNHPSSMWSAASSSDQQGHEEDYAHSYVYESPISTPTPTTNRRLSTPVPVNLSAKTSHYVAGTTDHTTAGFVDPYEMFPPPPHPVLTTQQVTAANSTRHSISGSDELSLGFEASRIWESRHTVGNNSNEAISRHAAPSHISYSPEVNANLESPNDDPLTLVAYKEHILPNGETLVTLGDVGPTDDTLTSSGVRRSSTAEIGYFSFMTYSQPYAEETKVMLFEISHKYLNAGEWKKLAHYWAFEEKHIAAIEYQDTGKNSYKDHGYRLMSIWLHGIEANVSPLNEVYQALIAINQTKLAKKLRERVEMTKRRKKGCRVQ